MARPGDHVHGVRSVHLGGRLLLILRDVLLGLHRFDELVASIGNTRTVLAQRLAHLIAEGVLERTPYQQRPVRFAYHLIEKGHALTPVIAHLLWWGDRCYPEPAGPPRLLRHRGCGGLVAPTFTCATCHTELAADDVTNAPGPGAPAMRGPAEGNGATGRS